MSFPLLIIPLHEYVGINTVSLSILKNFYEKNIPCSFFNIIKNKKNIVVYKKKIISIINLLKLDIKFIEPIKVDTDTLNYINHNNFNSLLDKVTDAYYQECIDSSMFSINLIQGLPLSSKNYLLNIKFNLLIAERLRAKIIYLMNSNIVLSIAKIECKQFEYNNFFPLDNHSVIGIILNNSKFDFINQPKKISLYNYKSKFNFSLQDKKKWLIVGGMYNDPDVQYISLNNLCIYFNAKVITSFNNDNFFIKKIFFLNSLKELQNNNIESQTLFLIDVIDIEQFYIIINFLKNKKIVFAVILIVMQEIIDNNITIIQKNYNFIPIFFVTSSKLEIFDLLRTIPHTMFHKKLQERKDNINTFSKTIDINFSLLRKEKLINLINPIFFKYQLKTMCQQYKKTVILPEGNNPLIIEAASICNKKNISKIILLGQHKKIYHYAKKNKIEIKDGIQIIDPKLICNNYITKLLNIRKQNGLNFETASKLVKNNIMLAMLMLKHDKNVAGVVAGIETTTSEVLRPAFQIIKCKQQYSLVSSYFFMLLHDRVIMYSDCAINTNPSYKELAEIAIQSFETAIQFKIKPRIAMLSYITNTINNITDENVIKVIKATKLVNKIRPDILIEGPIQYDAAISNNVSKVKCPNSIIKGKANIFIFPDLNTANITYKAVQRSTGSICIGPILQGINQPVNDLSRGASIEDILYTIMLTVIQSSS
ncbi:Phosphate acetyltransferase [Buchnera aphidicola (Thelaxes suberi)]|uniref:phosphate acetyltransferase n=1 Tax=Buchnera aphidicola TaxID=9 RepID=UPI003463B03C